MAAAGDDAPAGLFSGFWSRIQAAASVWRRPGQASRGEDGGSSEGEEAAVRSRLARRAAAARRVGRKLAFVSFNLEVLVFIYAFWRARRRSLTWVQPVVQVFPVLAIPALATLFYAAFVRFTRMLDRKDKRTLERLQEDRQQTDGEPRESADLMDNETLERIQDDKKQNEGEPREFEQNNQNNVQNCNGVDDASNSSLAADSVAQTAKLRKHRQSSIKHRDDGGADMAWGHSKDFQPAPSAGLRMRRLSSAKTYMTSSSFRERSVEKTQETTSVSAHPDQPVHVPFSTEDTIAYPFDDCHDSESAALSIHDQPADISQELPEGDGDEEGFNGLWDIVETRSSSSKENPISPVGSHNNFCERYDSSSPASPPDNFVAHKSLNDFTPNLSDLVLPASETFKEGVKEEALLDPDKSAVLQIPTSCAVNDKELIVTPEAETYPELLCEGVDETESAMFDIPEESTTPFNSEEVLPCPFVANNIKQCSTSLEFSVCGQETEKMEVAGSVNFINVSPELSLLSSPELVVESAEDATEKELCENTKEENVMLINMDEEALQDTLIVSTSTSEQCLETSDVSLWIQDAKAGEVTGIAKFVTDNPELMYTVSPGLLGEYDEDFKEDKMSGLHLPEQNALPFNFQKEPILDSSAADTADDVERTEVYDVVKEGLFESESEETFSHRKLVVASSNGDSDTQELITDSIHAQFITYSDINEALSEPLLHGTRHSEGMFLSSGEINNEEVYSLTPMESPTSCAVGYKELPITPDVESDPEFFGEGVKEIVSSKFHMTEESTSEGFLPSSLAVSKIEHCSVAPEFSLCGQETEKMEVAGSISFINGSPELIFLSSPEFVVGSKDASEKELCELNTEEENAHIVSTSSDEQCLETSDVSLCIQDAKASEVPGIINFVMASPEIMYQASPELLAEGHEDSEEDKASDFYLPEQNGLPFNVQKEPILDSLVADTAEHLLATPLYSEEVDITGVHDVVKEGLSEGEEAFNHRKLVVSCSEDDSNTQNLINNSMHEPLECGEEAFSEPLHQSTHHSEEMILSSEEINDDEFYPSNSNSYADVVEDAAPFVGLSKFEGEMAITSPDTPIFLDEVKSAAIVDTDIVSPKLGLQSELHDVGVEENEFSKFHVPEEISRTPFNLEEEVSLSPVALNNTEYSVETPEFSVYNQESEEMEVVESVSFIKVSPESSFLSSPEFVQEAGGDAREKVTCELSTNEQNETFINLEEEPLQAALVVSTTDQCLETSEFSLCSEDAKTTEVQEIISFGTLSPELNYTALPESLEEGEDLKDDEAPDMHLQEQKGLHFDLGEPFLEPLVVDTAEDALAKSELLMHTEVVKMTEVHGVVEEVFSESENEATFDHRNLVLVSSDDDSITQNFISNSTSAQFIPDASIKEASQAGQEALPEPPHESTCYSEGTFLSSDEVNHDEVRVEAPFDGQEGISKSEDEISLSSLETSTLLDDIRTAENLTANSGPSQSIPDSNGFQSLHDQEEAPSETLQDVNFLIEGSHTSSDEGINSEIFSLYSRSSSCVSEINMLETLRSGASSSPENEHDLSFDERSREIFHMDSTENYANSPVTAESILETNMIETLNVTDEATTGSLHESYSNFLDTFVAPDVINGMTQSDQHLDLSSSSSAPVVDAFETLQTCQGFPEPQLESDVTFQETQMSPKAVDDAENYFTNTIDDPQDSERTSTVALQDEDDLTLYKAYMSPEDISEVEKSLADDYASDLPHTPENHCFSEKLSPESQDPLCSEEIFVHPDNVLKAENDLDSAKPSLYSTEVNLAEPYGIDHEGTQKQYETRLGYEDDYVVRQEANSENHYNISGSVDIPDATVVESHQGLERSSSEIPYDGMFSFEGTLISLDSDSNAENFPSDSGSAMHTTQINTTSLLGLQEGSFKPEDENSINPISPYEVDTEETSSSNHGNSSSASSRHDISFMEAPQPQELPIDAGREKVFLEDEEPKDGESEDMKEIVQDLDDDHERKPVVTISHSTGSSTVSELAYVLYTKLATSE